MELAPIALEGDHVRLEPLTLQHAGALFAAALDPRIWQFTTVSIRTAADMQKYIETALDWQRGGTALPFVTMARNGREAEHRIVGSTRFANIDHENRRAEIGWTWITPEFWRTVVNTEAKYLMLRHAFETWKCIRVELKTSAKNERSRAAIARIGGKEEGILRHHMINADGSYRDSVYFGILDDEWPEVKRRLEERLARG
jgi:RimJ/RimL family protein N-acetyltransferase